MCCGLWWRMKQRQETVNDPTVTFHLGVDERPKACLVSVLEVGRVILAGLTGNEL